MPVSPNHVQGTAGQQNTHLDHTCGNGSSTVSCRILVFVIVSGLAGQFVILKKVGSFGLGSGHTQVLLAVLCPRLQMCRFELKGGVLKTPEPTKSFVMEVYLFVFDGAEAPRSLKSLIIGLNLLKSVVCTVKIDNVPVQVWRRTVNPSSVQFK